MIHERVISSRAFHCWFSIVDKHHQTTWQVPEDFCVFINGFLHWPSLPRLFFVVQFVPWKPNSGNLRKNDSWQTIANQSEGADVFKGFWFTSHTCSENWWLEDEFPFGARLIFRDYVSFRKCVLFEESGCDDPYSRTISTQVWHHWWSDWVCIKESCSDLLRHFPL